MNAFGYKYEIEIPINYPFDWDSEKMFCLMEELFPAITWKFNRGYRNRNNQEWVVELLGLSNQPIHFYEVFRRIAKLPKGTISIEYNK